MLYFKIRYAILKSQKGGDFLQHKQNLHIHTTYADGKDTPEQIVTAAIERGFDSIGFSEHSYMSFSDYPFQMSIEETEVYKKEIRALKEKYKGIIDIFCGLEVEMYSRVPTENFDYLIGSVHYLDFDGKILGFDRDLKSTLAYLSDNFGGDSLAFSKKYYEAVATLPDFKKFDIIGHFDLITKNNQTGKFIDTDDKKYLNLGFEAIHALRGKIPFFEVNTGAISRGYRTSPYPQMEFLREFKNCGFGVVLTSDCHDKNHLDCFFSESRELIAAAGFKTKWILTDNGFKEVEL